MHHEWQKYSKEMGSEGVKFKGAGIDPFSLIDWHRWLFH